MAVAVASAGPYASVTSLQTNNHASIPPLRFFKVFNNHIVLNLLPVLHVTRCVIDVQEVIRNWQCGYDTRKVDQLVSLLKIILYR